MPRQVNLSPTGSYALARNIASVLTQGFEFEMQLTKKVSQHANLFASIGYVRLNSTSSSSTPSFYISSHARNLTNFSILYTGKRFSFGLNGLYKEREPQTATTAVLAKQTSAYFVMNAKAEAFVIPQKFSAFIQVDNLFNRNYTDILGSQMPGRWVMGGLRLSLNK